MKRRNWWFGSGAFFSTIVATLMGLLGLTHQASADRIVPSELEEQYAQQVVEAEAKANGGQFAEALTLSEGIPVNSQHFTVLEEKQQMWAKLLLQQAREVSQRGEPQKAAALLRPLASRPNLAPEAQQLSAQWQRQAELLAGLEAAQAKEDWTGVLQAVEAIRTIDSDLANTPRLQEINQIATEKAFTLSASAQTEAVAKAVKPIATPASFIEELIGLGGSLSLAAGLRDSASPINIEIGTTAINPSEVEKQIRPNKPVAIVTPQPMPMPADVTSAKLSKQIGLASHHSSPQASLSITAAESSPNLSNPQPNVDPGIASPVLDTVPIAPVVPAIPAIPVEGTVQAPLPENSADLSETEIPEISFETVQKETQPKADYGAVVQ